MILGFMFVIIFLWVVLLPSSSLPLTIVELSSFSKGFFGVAENRIHHLLPFQLF